MEGKCNDHWQGIRFRIIAIRQPDTRFHLARFQHSALIHGSDGGTECRNDYIEKFHQFHFAHPYAGGIGRYSNPAVLVHRDCCPFHTLCVYMAKRPLTLLSKSDMSFSSFLFVTCRLGKQRLSALQR